ncbi:MAG TPA: ethylbenzene dehydrogenase-related protein [Acidobacteriota bacterium]|nr:ethylbenzene dehydrogenase-related protein [Acidobacteriota bacterium]
MRRIFFAILAALAAFSLIYLGSPDVVRGQSPVSLTAGVGTPLLDGIEDPGEWTSDSITTSRGIMVKAMMDEENFYILARWPDSTMSVQQNHWTWNGSQWNASDDEDRIAFIWEVRDESGSALNGGDGPSCQTMCHPGEGMAPRFGRVDVWHAKATRFLPVGHTDDKYWDIDGPDGRHSDSGSGSGDRNRNEMETGPQFRAASGPGANVTFLAADQAALDAFNAFGTQLGSADLAVPIEESDEFQENDTVAGRLLSVPTGNRASVRSVGSWAEGFWTVEFSRKLAGENGDGGMPEDFTARPGGSVRFVCEIFDNLLDHENHSFSPAGSGPADFTVYTLNFPQPTRLFFAQTGNGGGFVADHVFTNPSSERMVNATMNVFDNNGDPLEIDIEAAVSGQEPGLYSSLMPGPHSSVEFQIPPQGAVTIRTSGQGDVVAGSAEVDGDNAFGGVVRFEIPGIGIAGVGSSQALDAFIVPVRRTAAGIRTGIALHHADDAAAGSLTLHLTLRGEDGLEVASNTVDDFPFRGHLAMFIDELFLEFFDPASGPADFTGTLTVRAEGGQVAATALELGTQPGEFTTLPVIPVQ